MRLNRLLLLVAAVILAIPFAAGGSQNSRPPGVLANDWVPISENLGIVLLHPQQKDGTILPPLPPLQQPLLAQASLPPEAGYFVVRKEGIWVNLAIDGPRLP